ncbi:toprim domain-containing protein [Hymenobacter jeollabukensis]|uniref:Toprim domain-containing protein n=1 Tax=Hymenobacter jeollabukensis TaxID=2025313 RepID=A0A5R8WJ71_9BACT|nr:toprim domain-containing protein [Hymenobacter jeollabukensis]TLM88800.1 hypothetical protein FDY95_23485 [Hymenobacter jeollabukensis]
MSTPTTNQQAPPRRENSADELEHFKQDISLVGYATQQLGYTIKEESRRGDWHKLHKDGETLIVTRKQDGHEVYMNPGDDRDNGSIIDLVKARGGSHGQGLNLGQVRQTLRAYLNEDGPARDRAALDALPRPAQPAERLPVPEGMTDAEKRNFLIGEALGLKPELTNRDYLHSRGITDSTIDAPAFTNRVFTAQNGHHQNTAFPLYNETGISSIEEKNTNFKSMLPLPKDGIWVSQPTAGRGTPVERVVVTESAIDAMSKYQLEQSGGKGPNTMYVATSGNVTERQSELIQRLIDRQRPAEVTLANDNDAAGRRFNINYLNDLQPARKEGAVAGLPVYEQAAPPITWHATAAGKYHTGLRIEFNHDKAHEGRTAIANLTERIAQLNGGEQQADQPPLSMSVVRTSSSQSVVRVGAANSDMPALELLAREQHQQREQRLPEAERQPAQFFKIEYAQSKDYTRDLEMVAAGMTPEQRAAQAQRELQEKERIQQLKMQEAQQQQQLAEQQRQEQLKAQQQQERERQEQLERERQQNSPEAIRQRQEEDRKLSQFMVGAAAADAGYSQAVYPPPVRADAPGVDQSLIIDPRSLNRHVELTVPGTSPDQERQLQQLGQQLQQLGMTPGTVTSERGETSLIVAYRIDQPELRQIHDRLATLEQDHKDLNLIQPRAVLAERTDRVEGERVGPATWETSQLAATELYRQREPERRQDARDLRAEEGVDRSIQQYSDPHWHGEGGRTPSAQAWLTGREGEKLGEVPGAAGQERYLLINTSGMDGQTGRPLHASLGDRLHEAGAGVVDVQVRPAAGTELEQGQVRVAYHLGQPSLDAVHHELEQARLRPGVKIIGGEAQRAERVDVLAGQYVRENNTTLPALRAEWQLDQAPSAEKFAQESREAYAPPAQVPNPQSELKTSPYYDPNMNYGHALDTPVRVLQLEVEGKGAEQQQQLAEAGQRLSQAGATVADVVTANDRTYLAVSYRADQPSFTDVSRALDQEAAQGVTLTEPYAARFMRQAAVEDQDRACHRELNPYGPTHIRQGDELVPNPAPEFERARQLRQEQGLPTLEDERAQRQREAEQRYAQNPLTPEVGPGQPTPPGTPERTAVAEVTPDQAERQRLADQAQVRANELDKVAPPAELPKEETEDQKALRDRARELAAGGNQLAIIKVEEKVDRGHEQEPGKAERIHGAIEAAGANASEVKSVTTDDGIRHSEMSVTYRTDQPTIKDISATLDKAERSQGVEVLELPEHKNARQEAAYQADKARDEQQVGR